MGRAKFSHFVVTRGGKACTLLKHAAYAPDGVLAPAGEGEAPTQFTCVRELEHRYSTIYARRRALYAMTRTAHFIDIATGSTIDQQEFVKRIISATGEWKIEPIKCPTPPKSK